MIEKYLPDVCTIQYGFPFDSAQFSTYEGMPLIRIRDVLRGYSETFTTEKYKEEYIVYQNDLLIGMDGEFNIAKWGKTPALLNQRVCRLIPLSDLVDKNYLFYFMPSALKRIEEKTPFVTVKHLSAKELNKIKIPLPSLDEQRRIAAILDKVTDLINKRRAQLDKLDLLVKFHICLSNPQKPLIFQGFTPVFRSNLICLPLFLPLRAETRATFYSPPTTLSSSLAEVRFASLVE